MGCASSKSSRKGLDSLSWYNSPLSRKGPASSKRRSINIEDEEDHNVSLESSTYGVLNYDIYHGSFLNFCTLGKQYQPAVAKDDDFTFPIGHEVKPTRACDDMKQEDQMTHLLHRDASRKRECMEVINTWELMDDIEDGRKTPMQLRQLECSKLSIPTKKMSFNTAEEPNASIGGLSSPMWKKYYMQEDDFGMSSFPSRPTDSPFCESPKRPPSHCSLIDFDDSRSVSSYDGSISGLKILLSPANSASFHATPLAKTGSSNSLSLSCNENSLHLGLDYDSKSLCRSPEMTRLNSRKPSMDNLDRSSRYEHLSKELDHVKSPSRSLDVTRCSSRKLSMESVCELDVPVFDPSLMATFEEALKGAMIDKYDDWVQFSSDESVVPSSFSAYTWASSGTASDAETMPPRYRKERKLSSSKVMPIDELEDVKHKPHLASYELRCPPRGEGKVVLYFTSLRGVRRTYEDCCMLRLILRGLGVQVDERDVWMHSKFKEELMDVLGKRATQVPHLFIKGRYIGGAEEVKQLHEEGILAGLMEGLELGIIPNVCEGCGDYRFIPCLRCNGSCKVLNEDDEMSRCRDCNENGLIMCPLCVK